MEEYSAAPPDVTEYKRLTSLGDFDKIIGQSLCSQTAIPDQNRLHIQSARAISLCEITQMLCTMLTTAELIEVTFWKNNKWKLLVAALIVMALAAAFIFGGRSFLGPKDPADVKIGDAEYTCTFSISCATILDNMDLCNKEKRELVPENGWILEPVTVTFYEGESVFNVLQRTCMQQKIHLEFVDTPVYNSAYIEGINNIYEYDVGNLSGWMYKVNGWCPNYGCSRYQLQDGDIVEWVYTCSLGADVDGGSAVGNK